MVQRRSVRSRDTPHNPMRRVPLERLATVLANTKRIEIIAVLSVRPMSVSEIASTLRYDVSDMSKQLRSLRLVGLVESTRQGPVHLHQLQASVNAHIQHDKLHLSCTTRTGKLSMVERLDQVTLRCIETSGYMDGGR